ncbi:MAG: ATP-binding protein [Fibromonadaceae bacterium]|jgi:type II secretory pathway predicted ATPase ExeA|nr:ATP-binding protein [Fibromonadaceae bacterium]
MTQKYFNIAGPCSPNEHYMLDPLRNIGKELIDLINSKHYFVIHAARQSGKTTLLKELTRKINAENEYYALYCSLEVLQAFAEPEKGIPEIVQKLESCIRKQGLPKGFAKDADYNNISNVLNDSLADYCKGLDKPLVIFFDEADCLSNGTLITFLRQLRNGYIDRADIPFVRSVALVGMRNIRDYKAKIREGNETLGSASPFNIVAKTFNLENFTKEDVAKLYNQHTQETGQIFEAKAVDYVFEQTQGQPWLVNAIAYEAIEQILQKDYSKPITAEIAEQAIHNIVLARGTHFDSLMERLKEPRVRRVIEPLILGDSFIDRSSDDFLYTKDLGLIKEDKEKVISPSNPIYAEIMARALSWNIQAELMSKREYDIPKYIKNGKIDINHLLSEFQDFWRKNSEIYKERFKVAIFDYAEAAPHLVLQAFLQRVINGGGKIHREFAIGSGRADLCIEYGDYDYPIELKIFDGPSSVSEGLVQLGKYVERCKCNEGWLVMFDRDVKKSWEDKIYMKETAANGKKITVVGC